MESIMEMADWPCTPGPERLMDAEAEISRDARRRVSRLEAPRGELTRVQRDARTLLGMLEVLAFTANSQENLQRLYRAEQINGALDVGDIALEGSNNEFIGMVAQLREETGGSRYVITRLFRDREWAGLNPQLPHLRGLDVRIFGSHPSLGPALVVGAPSWAGRRGRDDGEWDPISAAIREAVLWHGAARCARMEEWTGGQIEPE